MPTAHRLDATDLPQYGTYTLRRALDRLSRRSDRLATVRDGRDGDRSAWWTAVRPTAGRANRA